MKILCVMCIPLDDSKYKNGINDFLTDYENFTTGVEHDFLFIFKATDYYKFWGLNFDELIEASGINKPNISNLLYTVHPNYNKDIGSYIETVKNYSNYDVIVFMSSSTRIHVDDWLSIMINCFIQDDKVKIVGTHGSYECYPCVRTNCFAVSKYAFNFMLEYKVKNDEDRMYFENRDNNITLKILKSGFKAVVVGKDKKSYEWRQWSNMNGFGIGDNMIVSDSCSRNPWRLSLPKEFIYPSYTFEKFKFL
jgi:hypothetical protein